jgi:hypothetical protein
MGSTSQAMEVQKMRGQQMIHVAKAVVDFMAKPTPSVHIKIAGIYGCKWM